MSGSHTLVALFVCFLIVLFLFTPPASSQGAARSLLLNGSSQAVTFASSSSLNVTGSITVEAWVKLNANGAHQVILSREAFQQAGTGGGYRLTISNTGKLRFDLFQSPTAYVTVTGSTTVSTATWHHVAGVFDGALMRVFLDGVMDGSLSTTSGPASGTGLFYIGRRSDVHIPYYFGGTIDDVRVSAGALYTSNFTPGLGPSSSIRGLWKFDGQTPNDFSPNGNNGTIQGGAGYSTDVPPANNTPPAVSLTAPLNNTSFAAGSNVVLDATASDADGTLSKVDFYQGATLLGTDTSAPYTFAWPNVPAGSYSLTAKATDNGGAVTTSSAIGMTVIAAGGNHSLSLNGTTAAADVPNSSSLNITGPITIEAWIKFNAIDGNYHDIVSRINRNDSSSGGGYSLTINNVGKLRLDLFQNYNAYTTVIGATVLSTNAWHHVAGVFDGSQIRLYVNGALDASLNTTNGPGSGSSLLRIGKAAHTAGAPPLYLPSFAFAGLIDEVRVSAAALYSSNFTAGLGPSSQVRGLWKFDSQSTNDFSGSGNDATLAGGASYSSDGPPASGSGVPQRPIPVAGGPYSAQVGQPVQLTSTGSSDPDGAISSLHWNFGDGTAPSNAVNPTHTYSAPGLYTVTLTAIDNSGLLASATAPVTITGTANARLDPMNQTGGGEENPLSQNYNWTLPLVSLPGRAATGLSLALSYNSLVWTRNGNYVSFDDDRGFPGPGFRLGFPVIQPLYYNPETARYAFLLLGSDGSRVELRQVGTSTLYEAADSSHLLLDASTMVLRTTDGTQLKYELKGSDYNCTEIKDRNGNFITVNYTSFGRIDNVVDTLGRVVRFNYDSTTSLTSITQTWNQGSPNQVTHNWATFNYTNTTIQTNFAGLSVSGPSNGSTIKTLSKVTLADNSHYDFSWTSWGQVWKISNFAADNHLLNYRSYNLPLTASTSQSDAPRFTERRDWAENWNENSSGIEQEAVTTYAAPVADSWTMPDGTAQTGIRAQVTAPDLTSHKIYFIGAAGTASGWRRGLAALVRTYDSDGVLRRQVTTAWTQDNTSLAYIFNPRVAETNTYDPEGNRARVQFTYQQVTFSNNTSCQLPRDVYEYAANSTTILRSTRTSYNTTAVYTDRRIIGLVSEKLLYEGNINSGGTLMSKTTFAYDESGSIQGTDAPVQHDSTNFHAGFVTGRGNLSSVKRYDVTNTSQFTTTSTKYNTAGSVVSAKDASNHVVQFSYSDSFSDGNNSRNTLAYATTVTDPDNYTSTTKYNFDFGAITHQRTPQPNTTQNLPGPEETRSFDAIGRLNLVTNQVNGSYVRYEYPASLTRVDTYATIQDGLGESHSFKITDGAGRVIATAVDHPGSVGGFSGQRFVHDLLGRTIKVSNPAETNANGDPAQWTTTGDDAATGWVFTQQTYDWKSRPRVTTNQDGTTKTASYAGCGCAGGEVVTLTDEGTIHAGVLKRRQQKIYADVLGRAYKTETLNWDGSVYASTVTTFNARDQVTQVREYAGAEGSATYQDTIVGYDGYARLQSKHVPEQAAGTATVWTYNSDDTVSTITDPRGASQTFSYNNRHLPTSITYSAPGPIPVPASVSYAYDAAANRTSMVDGAGSTSYQYDPLSRIGAETRIFSGLSGSYTLSYEYTLGGNLKSVTDHTNQRVNYGHDRAGRLNGITGANYSVSNFVSNISYRAWAGNKQVVYGNGRTLSATYNSRMQVTHLGIPSSGTLAPVMSIDYEYYDDGRLKASHDQLDNRFDRAYEYDHVARLTKALSGAEARGEPATTNRPYKQTANYDAFGHLTTRSTLHWSRTLGFASSDTYTNNRRNGWAYDANGNLLDNVTREYTIDAANRVVAVSAGNLNQFFDGDGARVKTTEPNLVTYYLRSTVLGAVVEELDSAGNKQRGFIYAGRKVVAEQAQNGSIAFVHDDSSGISIRKTNAQVGNTIEFTELDPWRAEAYANDPYLSDPGFGGGRAEGGPVSPGFGNIGDPSRGCTLDGVFSLCDFISRNLNGEGIALPPAPGKTKQPTLTNVGPGMHAIWVEEDTSWGTANLNTNTVTVYSGPGGHYEFVEDPEGVLETSIVPQIHRVTINKIKFVGDSVNDPDNRRRLEDRLQTLLHRRCADAFKRAGLPTPEEIINKGLTIASRPLLEDSSNNGAFRITDEVQEAFRESEADALTIQGQHTSDGRPVIFFRVAAFGDKEFLNEAVAHEFIHAAGVGQHPGWGYRIGLNHDLAGYEHYDDIIENCGFQNAQ